MLSPLYLRKHGDILNVRLISRDAASNKIGRLTRHHIPHICTNDRRSSRNVEWDFIQLSSRYRLRWPVEFSTAMKILSGCV